jgi:hypothetical protein
MRAVYTERQIAQQYGRRTAHQLCKRGNLVPMEVDGNRLWVIPIPERRKA